MSHDKHSAKSKKEQNTALSEALQAKQDNVHNWVAAVHYKHRTDRDAQIDEQVRRKQDATAQMTSILSEEVVVFAQYDVC